MSAASLRLDSVGHRYGGSQALKGVSLGVVGGVVTVLGPNGAGKTTLLRGVASVHRPTEGSIFVDGLDLSEERDRAEARRRIGYLPQNPSFAPRSTVFDVVDYLAICKEHHDRRRRHREVRRVLEIVELADKARSPVRSLSGGMVRRLGLAQALLGDPRLLVLDEPAAGLDPDQRLKLRDLLSTLAVASTILVSTHLTDEAAAVSSQVVVIVAGSVRFTGSAGALTALANEKVWVSGDVSARALRSWRQPDGSYRCLGDRPHTAEAVSPTLEDGYLLLVSA
ncbi:MAG: ATP-binding cassette domain-containing protein [Acidimicrobiales bacterium]